MSQETSWFYHLTTEEAKQERRHIWVWLGRIAVLLAALVAVAVSTNAYAETKITKHGKDFIRLLDAPCTVKQIVEYFRANDGMKFLPAFRLAEADLGGTRFAACWRTSIEPEGFYILFYEDGDTAVIPQTAFQTEGV
jgi:hypothetical protein